MKFLATVETVGLMFLALATNVVGAPSVIHTKSTSGLHHNNTIAVYDPNTIQTLFDAATELIAIQVVGLATSLDQLKYLCQAAASFTPRLESEYYNFALIKNVICTAASKTALPSVEEIQKLTVEIVTDIWVIQSVGAVRGKSAIKNLFHLINPAAASTIGLNGHVAKKNILAAAHVADQVAHSRTPAQVILAPSLGNSTFAPEFKAILPFIPIIEEHHNSTPKSFHTGSAKQTGGFLPFIPIEEHHHQIPKSLTGTAIPTAI